MKKFLTTILSYFEYLSRARLAGYYTRRGEFNKAKEIMQE